MLVIEIQSLGARPLQNSKNELDRAQFQPLSLKFARAAVVFLKHASNSVACSRPNLIVAIGYWVQTSDAKTAPNGCDDWPDCTDESFLDVSRKLILLSVESYLGDAGPSCG
jgi:hypothetical protein